MVFSEATSPEIQDLAREVHLAGRRWSCLSGEVASLNIVVAAARSAPDRGLKVRQARSTSVAFVTDPVTASRAPQRQIPNIALQWPLRPSTSFLFHGLGAIELGR